ncbi:MAG: hypothetical protein ACT7A5_09195 [Ferrovibrionaceae bacterium]
MMLWSWFPPLPIWIGDMALLLIVPGGWATHAAWDRVAALALCCRRPAHRLISGIGDAEQADDGDCDDCNHCQQPCRAVTNDGARSVPGAGEVRRPVESFLCACLVHFRRLGRAAGGLVVRAEGGRCRVAEVHLRPGSAAVDFVAKHVRVGPSRLVFHAMLLAMRSRPGPTTAGGMTPVANVPGGTLAATEPLPADRSEWASRHPSAASLGLDHVDNGMAGIMFLHLAEK